MAEIGEAVKRVITHTGGKIGYVVRFAKYVVDLSTKTQELENTREDLQLLINASLNNNEIIKRSVTNWLEMVDIVVGDAKMLIDKAVNINSPVSKYKTGKKVFKMIGVIESLLEEKNNFTNLGDPKLHQSFGIVSDGNFEAFSSREDTTMKVIEALQNNQVSMIGVFGMPGVGKTMLMKAISKQAKDEKLFDEVVLVIVSQNPDIRTIQKNIAEQLDLDLGESSIPVAAMKLSQRLNQGKKVLIAFDDIWKELDMTKVGIPYSIHGCKVLFTTRSEGVCDRMEVHEKIEVRVLSDNDAWKLFRQKAGDVVDYSSHQEVALDVCNECNGLPLAIVTLGLALRNKDKTVWLDASTQLKRSMYKGMGPAIAIVKLSYDYLHDDKAAQMCFLFCSLFPEDFRIKTDILLSYMLGEELLEKKDNMEEARNRLFAIVDTLRSSSLLLESKGGDIMMHHVIRDAAICIASNPKEDEGFIVKSGLGLEEWSLIDGDMEKCKRLSLMSNNLSWKGLPRQISASILFTLSLFRNQNLVEIPSDFFKEMKHLKTLDLSKTGIISLPPSFQCLESLQTLYMEECVNLTNISLVAELQRLLILSIRDSRKVEIPVSMQKLTNLRMLNASDARGQFPSKVISSLHRLEELYLDRRFAETELVFSEVASLTRLTRLTIHLPVVCMLKDFPSHWKNLSKFSIHVGEKERLKIEDELGTRRVSLNLGSSTQNFPPSIRISNWVGVLLEKIEHLELHDCNLLTVADLNGNGLYQNLRTLHVNECTQVRHLLSTTSLLLKLFSNLEELSLYNLVKFVAICDGPIPDGFLYKLKKLKVMGCPTVSILIPFGLIRNLQRLEKINVESCDELQKVVQLEGSMSKLPPSLIFPVLRKIQICNCNKLKCVLPIKAARHLLQLEELDISWISNMEMVLEGDGDNADKDKVILPSLKTLKLWGLSSLSSFGPPGLLFDFPALIEMKVGYCWNLKRLPLLDAHSVPELKELKLDSGWLDGLIWRDESLKFHLKSLPGLVESKH